MRFNFVSFLILGSLATFASATFGHGYPPPAMPAPGGGHGGYPGPAPGHGGGGYPGPPPGHGGGGFPGPPPGHGGHPGPSQVPHHPGYECPDKDSSGHPCNRQENLGNGHIKCWYEHPHEGNHDNHCTYDISKGSCTGDHNYNRCSSTGKSGDYKHKAAPPTPGHVARAPILKQAKIKRNQKNRLPIN